LKYQLNDLTNELRRPVEVAVALGSLAFLIQPPDLDDRHPLLTEPAGGMEAIERKP
jgi:hypothetical protein